MEIFNELMGAMGHVFNGVLIWKITFGVVVILSGVINIACWILEAWAVWDALAHDDSSPRRFLWWEFKLGPMFEMITILVGIAVVIIAALSVIYAQLLGMIVLGVIGLILLSLMSKRVKQVAKAIFFLVLDMTCVLIVRALIIGDGGSEAMLFGTSIIALCASGAITLMRGNKLVIEKGRYVFKLF